MNKFIIGTLCLLIFYVGLEALLLGGMTLYFVVLAFFVSTFLTAIPVGFLSADTVSGHQYSIQDAFLMVAIVQIVSILGFIGIVSILGQSVMVGISPLTGYIVFGISILLQLVVLAFRRQDKWVWIGSGIYLIIFGVFALWQYVNFGILMLLFLYVVLYNITIISYGVLQYLASKKQLWNNIEMEFKE